MRSNRDDPTIADSDVLVALVQGTWLCVAGDRSALDTLDDSERREWTRIALAGLRAFWRGLTPDTQLQLLDLMENDETQGDFNDFLRASLLSEERDPP